MTEDKKGIAAKIGKILAKAESTTHEAEAEMLMAKVHQLLEQHGISLLDVGRLDADDPVGVDREVYTHFASANYATSLMHALVAYYGCQTVVTRIGNRRVFSVGGRESARITFAMMASFVRRQVVQQARAAVKAGMYATVSRAETAIGNALTFRVWRLVRESRANQTEVAAEQSRALVPVDMIALALAQVFPNLTQGKARAIRTDRNAVKIASEISLARQTAGTTVRRIGK